MDEEEDLVVEEPVSDELGDINLLRSFSFKVLSSSLSKASLFVFRDGPGLKSAGRNLVTSSFLIGMFFSLCLSEKLSLILLVSGTFFPSSICSLSSAASWTGLAFFLSFDLKEEDGLKLCLGFSDGGGMVFSDSFPSSPPLLPRSSWSDLGLYVVVDLVVVVSDVLNVNRLSLGVVLAA